MNIYLVVFIGTGITFLATALGASFVLFFKKISINLQRVCMGFASGIMVAASIWSLIIPAIDSSQNLTYPAWVPAVVGIAIGTIFLYLLDKIIPHIHLNEKKYEGGFFVRFFSKKNKHRIIRKNNKIIIIEPISKNKVEVQDNKIVNNNSVVNKEVTTNNHLKKTTLLMTAVTLHNIPEGMAVALAIGVASANGESNPLYTAYSLILGMSLQNIPEGAAISLPLRQAGFSKWKSFLYGALSGIVEPIFGLISIALVSISTSVLPYFLTFAAGAMLYVVVEELIPESNAGDKHSNIGVITFMIGFTIMMVLDVAFGS